MSKNHIVWSYPDARTDATSLAVQKLGTELGFNSDAYQRSAVDLSIGGGHRLSCSKSQSYLKFLAEVNETTKSVVLENCLTCTTERRSQMLQKIDSQLRFKQSVSSSKTYSRSNTGILDVKGIDR